MTRSHSADLPGVLGAIALAVCLGGVTAGAAQAPGATAAPTVGQVGKDVEWVPTPDDTATKMLDLAQVRAGDTVIDLGSGDGKLVIAAALRGARSIGVEYEPDLVAVSIERARQAGVADRTTFVKADLFDVDLSQATVITMFLLPDLNLKLRPKLLTLAPGTRIVSNTWDMEEWEPDATVKLDCPQFCNSLLWIVPAQAAGRWRADEGELELSQTFQKLGGTLREGGRTLAVGGGRLRGDRFEFQVGDVRYAGRVSGTTLQGTRTPANGAPTAWTARRP